jgi:DNA anti-recombination protein RmuC
LFAHFLFIAQLEAITNSISSHSEAANQVLTENLNKIQTQNEQYTISLQSLEDQTAKNKQQLNTDITNSFESLSDHIDEWSQTVLNPSSPPLLLLLPGA